jgi:hypothetical protein
VAAYKRYIKGAYYQNSELKEKLTAGMQKTLGALRKGYPDGWTYEKLADAYELSKNSTYQNCRTLHKENIVKGEVERPQKYYFEDYNQ